MSANLANQPIWRHAVVRRLHENLLIRGCLGSVSGRIGLALVLFLVALALISPFFSPFSPTEIVGIPFEKPSGSHPFGTDSLGRDVLSRFLFGGRTLVAAASLATVLAYLVGVPVGLASGYRRGLLDLATVGVVDLLIAFPPIVFALVLVAGVGSSLGIVIVAIAAVHAPRVVRIVRGATSEVSTQEFIEAAVARGERPRTILRRDILPNIWTPVLADFGLRLTGSIILVSSLSYLGLGPAPPAADWGLMISENRAGLLIQPWVVVLPAATIALLAIGVNLIADSVARSVGRPITGRSV